MATRSAKIDQKAGLIWAIADKLTGVYKPHEYEIPFTRYFYKYEAPRSSEEIMELEKELSGSLEEVFC